MNEKHPVAWQKALVLCEWMKQGRYVTTRQGKHRGKKGFIISVTQPPFREPMMDLPGDPPLLYAEIAWPTSGSQPIDKDYHQVADISLFHQGRSMKIQHSLWMVLHQQDVTSIHNPLWVQKSTSDEKSVAHADYLALDRKHKILIEWSILGGIKILKADFNETERIDWKHVSYRALPEASDIAWEVAIAVVEYYKDGFLFRG